MQQTLIGNVGGEPELRFTPNGHAVVNFSLAVSKRVKADDGSWGDGPTTWYRVDAWRKNAENIAESLTQGDRVIVVGEIENRQYEKDGEKRYSLEVHATEVGLSTFFSPAKSERAGYSHNRGHQADEAVPF